MRTKDKNKMTAIRQATLRLAREQGIQNLSMAKIAKQAHVSPATLYIYYPDQKAMFSQIYLEVKDIIDGDLYHEVDRQAPVRVQFEALMLNYAHTTLSHPDETNFMQAVQQNPSLVSEAAFQKGQQRGAYLEALYQRGVAEQLLQALPLPIVVAHTFQPLAYLVQTATQTQTALPDKWLKQSIQMSWNALRV
ncbi:hypothetical protein IV38_GL001075 [Lactobacillus selangorensis]|uniref:HTH tetR-type domain-containing protein n=2 Tax=Lactobacillus selangorensis TaxID=81857 RepID=A0A0R2FWH7_9LACO|nr:hypothetical protein IV38_GL001075 [Lactobacillus selangorensis]KRN32723.1 hypothetical protein IV40_GL000778 [Lactobacillus selangorensis]